MDGLLQNIELFSLFFGRISAFVFLLPVLGNRTVPLQVKVGLSIFLSIFLVSVNTGVNAVLPTDLLPFILLVVKEVVVGLVLGFTTKFLFAGVQLAGETVGRQMGFGLARVMDPGFNDQTSVVSEFQIIVVFLIYLTINGHHFLLQGLMESYEKLPVAAVVISGNGLGEHMMRLASGMFLAGVKIGAPVIVALLLTNVALGLIARTVPQMNIFIVGLPLRILVGLLAMSVTISLFMNIFRHLWLNFQIDFVELIRIF